MSESIREWPPRKSPGEPDNIWLSRLEQGVAAEYQDWLSKFDAGDPETLLEVAQSIIENEEVAYLLEDESSEVDEELSYEEAAAAVIRYTACSDQYMAAVRNGNHEAVREYAEFNLFSLKFNTLNEK
ncbi:hypothetical protein BH10PAT3_BH10PAT3_8140 [soil metagenome]